MTYHLLTSQSGRIQVCGHRGHSVAAPENTLPALRAAAEAGGTSCEIDVMLTRDGELVLLHDELLDRTTDGKGPLAQVTLAELRRLDAGSWFGGAFAGTPVPTLAEAILEARRIGLGLVVELKERQRVEMAIARLAAVVDELGAAPDLVVISFDHPSLLRVRATAPAIRTETITHARHVDMVGVVRAAGASSVSIELEMFHAGDAAALHAAGIAIRCHLPRPDELARRAGYGLAWEPELAEALSGGMIDCLSGDDVGFLAALVARHRAG
jgi:glycerophosphoryl diester phosphodiesterase